MPQMVEELQDENIDPLFRTMVATAVDGIMVIDETGHILLYNAACEKLFGYAADEVLGRNVKMLMPAPYRDEHDSYLKHYRETGEKKIIGIGREVSGQRKDDTIFPMYLSVGEGRFRRKRIFVGIVHDLTGREATRKRLREVQAELLHVSRLSDMAQMVAALAHEMNQPLTAIMNYVKAGQRTLAGGDAAAQEKTEALLEKAAGQTERAGKIIRRLRDFIAKRESVLSSEDLNEVVREAFELGSVGAVDSGVELRLSLMDDSPTLPIDRVQIQQVVINLVRNAIDAMEAVEHRTLGVETRAVEPGFVEVAVSDTGPGLAPEVASQLFRPFVTTKETGMGIGLTICQSIIEAHNGRIWATPNAGGGVTFHFALPLSA